MGRDVRSAVKSVALAWPGSDHSVTDQYRLTPMPPPDAPLKVLALFNKTVRKLYQHIRSAKEAAVERSLPAVTLREAPAMLPHEVDVEEELDEAARAVREELKAKYLKAEDLQHYAIAGVCGSKSAFGTCVLGGAGAGAEHLC
jgi:hypothetical protein